MSKPYFPLSTADRTPPGVFTSVQDITGFDGVPGLTRKPIMGEKLIASFVDMEPHTEAPEPCQPEEQMGTILEGEYAFHMNGEKICKEGDVDFIPPKLPHKAYTLEKGSLGLDLFNPARGAFRALQEAAGKARGKS